MRNCYRDTFNFEWSKWKSKMKNILFMRNRELVINFMQQVLLAVLKNTPFPSRIVYLYLLKIIYFSTSLTPFLWSHFLLNFRISFTLIPWPLHPHYNKLKSNTRAVVWRIKPQERSLKYVACNRRSWTLDKILKKHVEKFHF